MRPSFTLTQEQIESADIYDNKKHAYIQNYWEDSFVEKLPLLSRWGRVAWCLVHNRYERYTVEDEYSAGGVGSCPGASFADWTNTFSIYCMARFECGNSFPIGFYLQYRYRDLIRILEQLRTMSDRMLLCGKKFDENNQLVITTGGMGNSLELSPEDILRWRFNFTQYPN